MTYLESECEEVHDVIGRWGVLDVAAVHVHRVHELEKKLNFPDSA